MYCTILKFIKNSTNNEDMRRQKKLIQKSTWMFIKTLYFTWDIDLI